MVTKEKAKSKVFSQSDMRMIVTMRIRMRTHLLTLGL